MSDCPPVVDWPVRSRTIAVFPVPPEPPRHLLAENAIEKPIIRDLIRWTSIPIDLMVVKGVRARTIRARGAHGLPAR